MKLTRFSVFLVGLAMMGLAVSLSSNVPDSEAAFGTSPPWVRNDHLLPGTTYESIINLSRNNPDNDMKVNIRFDGDKEIKKWLEIENEKNLIMKKGQKIFPMKVIVEVPKRAALRDYKGGIFVTLESIEEEVGEAGTVAIKLGSHIVVELTVTGDKILDYRVKTITLDALNEGDFFYLNTEVENLGNVEITELNGQVDIYDYKEKEILNSLTFGQLSDAIEPNQLFKSQIVFPDLKLDAGEYWVKVKVFKDDEVIYENRLFQAIKPAVVPVITSEDVGADKRPSIPDTFDGGTVLSPEEMPENGFRTAAPIVIKEEGDKLFLIFGLIGFAVGMVALLAVIVFLIIMLRRQQQDTLRQYLKSNYENQNK